jgi:hypothetical protein
MLEVHIDPECILTPFRLSSLDSMIADPSFSLSFDLKAPLFQVIGSLRAKYSHLAILLFIRLSKNEIPSDRKKINKLYRRVYQALQKCADPPEPTTSYACPEDEDSLYDDYLIQAGRLLRQVYTCLFRLYRVYCRLYKINISTGISKYYGV